jgi:hypothetical protein
MSSQLVDINEDGNSDILVGSFSGVPYLIKGSPRGFTKPEQITDASGQAVLIADFWNDKESKWDTTERANSEGHCTSVSAVDWDDDGDLDLLLGDYYGGRVYLRENQGDAKQPKFAATNQVVMAGDAPTVIDNGLAAPRIVEWDGDGRFDILCGGAKGGVYFFKNIGRQKAPKFAAAETLIAAYHDTSNSFVMRVPAKNGQPTLPGSSYHIEPVDYDSDGDLDILVGARSSWLREPPPKLTDKEKKEVEEINKSLADVRKKLLAAAAEAKTDEAREALKKSGAYQKLIQEYQQLSSKRSRYRTDPIETGDFVWVYRRK